MRKTYRGKLPKTDKRGYVRPEIAGKRFTLGHIDRDSQGEMRRRRDAIADLFELQCQQTGEGRWMEPFHGFAIGLISPQSVVLAIAKRWATVWTWAVSGPLLAAVWRRVQVIAGNYEPITPPQFNDRQVLHVGSGTLSYVW